MNNSNIIAALESEWSLDGGYLGQLRRGQFDRTGHSRMCNLLKSLNLATQQQIDRRVVSLIWMIPLFMTWQQDRVVEGGTPVEVYQTAMNEIEELMEHLLGVP